jgi:LysM repeat protein
MGVERENHVHGGAITDQVTTTTLNGSSQNQPTTDTANYYWWWDTAVMQAVQYMPNCSTTYATTYNYDPRNFLTDVYIQDGAPRHIYYQQDLNGQTLTLDTSISNSPHTRYIEFNGVQRGEVTNNGTTDVDYIASIADNTTKPGTGYFLNGSTSATPYADFSANYVPVNGLSVNSTSSLYTVQAGDTLQSIALQIWGDANFWYLIADANGLDYSSTLTAGQDLVIPNKVANADNNSSTYRVYDPNTELGNTSPTHPPRPTSHHSGCGIFGEILLAIVAVVVSVVTYGALTEGAGALLSGSALFGSTTATTIAAGAVAGVAGSVASQVVGLATGIQSKFSWIGVAEAAIGGAVGGG